MKKGVTNTQGNKNSKQNLFHLIEKIIYQLCKTRTQRDKYIFEVENGLTVYVNDLKVTKKEKYKFCFHLLFFITIVSWDLCKEDCVTTKRKCKENSRKFIISRKKNLKKTMKNEMK